MKRLAAWLVWSLCIVIAAAVVPAARGQAFRSHPPTRPLPQPSSRAMAAGPAYFVDVRAGDDGRDGRRDTPWKTIGHALAHITAGDVLYLRGGVYYEQVVVKQRGTREKPVTIRAFPGELAVLDGGLRQFFEAPGEAWTPVAGSAPPEYRSRQKFPGLQRVAGNFGDSLLPLHAYRQAADFRSPWQTPLREGSRERQPFYVGPGLWYDADSGRVHARLDHTRIQAFGSGNYRGETDPRQLPLVVAGWHSTPLTLQDAAHVRIQDLVLRGGGDHTLLVRGCRHVELDGVTVYAANRGLRVETTGPLRVVNCLFRGSMPPWGSRTASKYLAADSHLFVPVGTDRVQRDQRQYYSPQCHDFEIAHCEFTDGHDGPYIGGVQRLEFHHNLVDNLNDDGVYLSAWGPPGSDVRVHHNYLSRCLTVFAFGLGRGSESDPGSGVYVYRNIIDLRAPVPYGHPLPEDPELTSYGRLCGDHGGPVWEPLFFYHNTVISQGAAFRGYYAAGWGGHTSGTRRRLFNNIFVQVEKLPGLNFDQPDSDLQADANLHWSVQEGPGHAAEFFTTFRASPVFAASKKKYEPGWTSGDRFADPRFQSFAADGSLPLDLRLRDGSPAIDGGLELPGDWPDPLRTADADQPDLGALPAGAAFWQVGPRSSPSR